MRLQAVASNTLASANIAASNDQAQRILDLEAEVAQLKSALEKAAKDGSTGSSVTVVTHDNNKSNVRVVGA